MKIYGILTAGIASAVLTAFASAKEPTTEGAWYMGGYIGPNFAEALDLKVGVLPIDGDIRPDRGFKTGLTYGYAFPLEENGRRWRLEVEISHSDNVINENEFQFIPGFYLEQNGDIVQQSIMFNAYRDFAQWRRLTPYLGAGLGLSRTEIDFYQGIGVAIPPGFQFPLSGGSASNLSLTFQLMAGLEYEISENWSAYGEARVSGTLPQDYALGSLFNQQNAATPITFETSDNFINTSFLLGVKYTF